MFIFGEWSDLKPWFKYSFVLYIVSIVTLLYGSNNHDFVFIGIGLIFSLVLTFVILLGYPHRFSMKTRISTRSIAGFIFDFLNAVFISAILTMLAMWLDTRDNDYQNQGSDIAFIISFTALGFLLLINWPRRGASQADYDAFIEAKGVNELVRQYTTKQLKHLRSVDSIETYSIEKLDRKMKDLIGGNINKFAELLKLEGITPPTNKDLSNICYIQSHDIISSVNDTLKVYLRGQLLEEDLTDFDIQLEIENLLTEYEDMEIAGSGKV